MNEFSSKLGGFSKYKKEMSDANTATGGIDPKNFDLGKSVMGMRGSEVGQNKGLNAGGSDFTPTATKPQAPTLGQAPTGGSPTGYNSNDGVIKNINDNVTNHVSRGIQNTTGAGYNNQRSFAKQPSYGQKDLSHLESNRLQRRYGGNVNVGRTTFNHINNKKGVYSGRFYGSEGSRKQLGRGLVTSELFGKVGDNN